MQAPPQAWRPGADDGEPQAVVAVHTQNFAEAVVVGNAGAVAGTAEHRETGTAAEVVVPTFAEEGVISERAAAAAQEETPGDAAMGEVPQTATNEAAVGPPETAEGGPRNAGAVEVLKTADEDGVAVEIHSPENSEVVHPENPSV